MVYECEQSKTTSSIHMKKNIEVNTFHDGLKVWMDLYRHCVCPWSYLKYVISIEIWQLSRECPWRSWRYLIWIITRGLCSYNARLFDDYVTAIGVSYWRKMEFPNYARLHRGKIYNTLSNLHFYWLTLQNRSRKCGIVSLASTVLITKI